MNFCVIRHERILLSYVSTLTASQLYKGCRTRSQTIFKICEDFFLQLALTKDAFDFDGAGSHAFVGGNIRCNDEKVLDIF